MHKKYFVTILFDSVKRWGQCSGTSDTAFYGRLCNRADHYIFILFLLSFLFFFFPRLISAALDWIPYFGIWCGLSANLECRSEMRCTRLAANTGRKKSQSRHHRTTLSGHIFATKACIDNRKTC